MMDDERRAVFREDVFVPSMEKDVTVHFSHRFRIVPGRGPNEPMVRPFITPVEEVVSKSVLELPQRFDARHDIGHGDAFAEVLKQPVAE